MKCKTCKEPYTANELTPEEECFACSTGTPAHVPVNNSMLRESMDNIVGALAHKTGMLKRDVRKAWKSARGGES